MADGSMFARLDDEEQILTVGMNEVAILEPDDDYVAIGTRDLNACSGVVIMGRGIIMAHISPYPTGRSDNGNSDGLAGINPGVDSRYPSTKYSNHDVERKYPLERDGMGETVTLHDERQMPEHVYGTPIKQLSVGMSRDLREELPYAPYYIMRLLTKRM
ncbi:hypothetical protein LTR48_006517 [Friedmanniomyces endolithicus]|uniref:Uncharacterized protein n=1 Tax=Rachicladosporium monterosium TaxID=1507873 RepID=A0ABR0L0A1_9PEZI|nr:hypothetical protein LTR48_006517 [Friedmanniomyces endolithicus]KAK1809359.1 hypothetical protein LTR12_016273 [Friedmanniomyces endolithicus]KAK5141493.1 hypothetical protein LTR32_005957 [Rachicladosporium monterosium]